MQTPTQASDTSLDKGLINETENIKIYLNNIKADFDNFDRSTPSAQQQIDFIEKRKTDIFLHLDNHFFKTWGIVSGFPKDQINTHQLYYQKELVPLFDVSPYNKRVYNKPLGYAGDYKVMLYLYEDGYEGDSTYAKLIHRYSMSVPAARANHNRKYFYKSNIVDFLNKLGSPKITSIAAGPAVEITEVLQEDPRANNAYFSCLDFEKLALDYIKEKVSEIENVKKTKYHVNYINADIMSILSQHKIDALLDGQDLIYCSGLLDYFSDRIAEKIIGVLFNKINNNGRLIIGNVYSADRHRAYTEFLGGWEIKRRNEADMAELAKRIKNYKSIDIKFEEETKMNIFLIMNKS